MIATILAMFCASCGPVDQTHASIEAALLVPVSSATDRQQLLDILRKQASFDDGVHVVVQSGPQHFVPPEEQATIEVAVWREQDDRLFSFDSGDDVIAFASDTGHPTRVAISFLRGVDPHRERPFRNRTISAIERAWPEAERLPIIAGRGGLPSLDDLQMTSEGYKLDPSRAAKYGLPETSPLVAGE